MTIIRYAGLFKIEMNFNSLSAEIFKRHAFKDVLLLWDRQSKIFALNPVSQDDLRAYRISYSLNGSSISLSGKRFLDWIGYTEEGSRLFSGHWNDPDSRMEFDMSASI
jgi:hypothetical protein